MSSKTKFLNLKKPDSLDYYNIEDFNNNADIIDKKTQELANNADTDRKRVDNLLQSNTVDTQEIGKVVLTTSYPGTEISMSHLDADVVYDKMFNNVSSIDSDFCSIPYPQAGYVAKISKIGLYHMKFCVSIKDSAGISETVMRIMLHSSNALDGEYTQLRAEYFVFPQSSSLASLRNVEFVFAITEPTYIKILATSIADGSGTFDFRIGDCQITAIDWKEKKSGAAAETADIRLGADGQTYKTAGEAVRKQFESVSNECSELNEFCREGTGNLSEYILGTPNLVILSKLKSKDGFTVHQISSERNKIFIVNKSAKTTPTWEIANCTVYEPSEYYTDSERLVAGSEYIIFGATSDVTIKFYNQSGGIIDDTIYCNYTSQNFTIPEDCKCFKIYVDLFNIETFLDIFICKARKTLQGQIDDLPTAEQYEELLKKIKNMEKELEEYKKGPKLTVTQGNGLQITRRKESE